MHRIDNATAAVALPTPAALGTPGYFRQRSGATKGTIVSADWLNAVQEEICYVIEEAGLTLDKTDRTQLKQALDIMIEAAASEALADDLDVLAYKIFSSSGDINLEPFTGIVAIDGDYIQFNGSSGWIGEGQGGTDCYISFGASEVKFSTGSSGFGFEITDDGFSLNSGTGATVDEILDEDNMASDSATALTTQSAVKNYVDTKQYKAVLTIDGYTHDAIAAGATKYISKGATTGSAPGGSDATKTYTFIMPVAGSIGALVVYTDDEPGTSETYACTIYKNGSSTALTCTINATEYTANDIAHSVSVAAGDAICLQLVSSASANALARVNFSFSLTPS